MHISPVLNFCGIQWLQAVEDNGELDLICTKECQLTHFALVFASRPVVSCSFVGHTTTILITTRENKDSILYSARSSASHSWGVKCHPYPKFSKTPRLWRAIYLLVELETSLPRYLSTNSKCYHSVVCSSCACLYTQPARTPHTKGTSG